MAKTDAIESLREAKQNLESARLSLKEVQESLERSEEESERRTEEALAAQRNVVDFVPRVYEQETLVQHLEREEAQLQREVEHAEGAALRGYQTNNGLASSQQMNREALVADIMQHVNYEQNRILEAQELLDAALLGSNSDGATGEAEMNSYVDTLNAQIEDASMRVQEAQEDLDLLQDQLEDLCDIQKEAEEAEAEARAQVKEYRSEEKQLQQEVSAANTAVTEAQRYEQETDAWIKEAENSLNEAMDELSRSEYNLMHFGEMNGFQMGMEYYHWNVPVSGHQFYSSLNYFATSRIHEHKMDFSLGTGYVKSSTGLENGAVSGWTDTALNFMLHNDHKINSIRYLFGISAPTGISQTYQNAIVPVDVARFTDFGSGWQFTPGLELVHNFTEIDRLTYRTSFNFRQSYFYAKERERAEVNPGDVWEQTIEYLHLGERWQELLQLSYARMGETVQDGMPFVREKPGNGNHWAFYDQSRYQEGKGWEARYFYNHQYAPKDEFEAYFIYGWDGATTQIHEGNLLWGEHTTRAEESVPLRPATSVRRFYAGIGGKHRYDLSRRLRWGLHYKDTQGTINDPLHKNLNSNGYRRYSLTLGYEFQINSQEQFNIMIEKEIIKDRAQVNSNGWGCVVLYNRSL